MTPFGQYMRYLRQSRQITLKEMALELNLSSAYLSALEHGWRGAPQTVLIQQICRYFNLWGEEAQHLINLAKISDPKISVNTGGLSPKATELANILAQNIHLLDDETLEWILQEIQGPQKRLNNQYILPPSVFRRK